MAAQKSSAARGSTVSAGTIAKLVVSVLAVIVGLFLVFGATTPSLADGVFVGAIAVVLAIYLWPGVTLGQGRVIAVVLVLVAVYAFIRGFGVLELALIRQLGGITAIISGVILALPFIRPRLAKK